MQRNHRIKENNRIFDQKTTGKGFKRVISLVLCLCIFFSCSGFSYAVSLDTLYQALQYVGEGIGLFEALRNYFSNSSVSLSESTQLGIAELLDKVLSPYYQQHSTGAVSYFASYKAAGSNEPYDTSRNTFSIYEFLSDISYNTAYLEWIKNLLSNIKTDTGNIASRISTTNTRLSSVISGLTSVEEAIDSNDVRLLNIQNYMTSISSLLSTFSEQGDLYNIISDSYQSELNHSYSVESYLNNINSSIQNLNISGGSGSSTVNNTINNVPVDNPGYLKINMMLSNVSPGGFFEPVRTINNSSYTFTASGNDDPIMIIGFVNVSLRTNWLYDNTTNSYVNVTSFDLSNYPWLCKYNLIHGHSYTINRNGVGNGQRLVGFYYGLLDGLPQVFREYLDLKSYTSQLDTLHSDLTSQNTKLDTLHSDLSSQNSKIDDIIDLLPVSSGSDVDFDIYVPVDVQIGQADSGQIMDVSSSVRGLLSSGSSVPALFVALSDSTFFSFFSSDVSEQINGSLDSEIEVLSFLNYAN